MNEIERRDGEPAGLECRGAVQGLQLIRQRAEGDAGDAWVLRGHAAVFYDEADPDGTEFRFWFDFRERIGRGAFDAALDRPDDVRILTNHDPSLLLGRNRSGTARLSTDDRGLVYEVDLDPESSPARDVMGFVRRGDMTGSSFAFVPHLVSYYSIRSSDGERDPEGDVLIREIEDLELWDAAPVTYPAYSAADVSEAGEDARGGPVPRVVRAARSGLRPEDLERLAEHRRRVASARPGSARSRRARSRALGLMEMEAEEARARMRLTRGPQGG